MTLSSSPPSKRLKLDSSPTAVDQTLEALQERSFKGERIADDDGTENEHQCSICLQAILDRTVMPTCSHEFCFECILVWSGLLYALCSLSEITHSVTIHRAIKTMPIMFASHWTVCYSRHPVQIRLPKALSNPIAHITRTVAGSSEGGSGRTYSSKAYRSRKRTGYKDERRKGGE
jgi:Zinc finger, C3HC4 type (RING finger)